MHSLKPCLHENGQVSTGGKKGSSPQMAAIWQPSKNADGRGQSAESQSEGVSGGSGAGNQTTDANESRETKL